MIDIQNDFLPGGSLPVPGGDKIIPIVNKIQENFELIIATQDWHPPQHVSFAGQHPGKKPFDTITVDHQPQTLWPDHCIQESQGAQFPSSLKTKKVEAIIRKGTDPDIDSYSAFYDNHHRKKTGLTGYLREKGADELFFCGLAADVCVYYSLLDAVNEGFICHLFTNATSPIDQQQFQKIQQELLSKKVRLNEG